MDDPAVPLRNSEQSFIFLSSIATQYHKDSWIPDSASCNHFLILRLCLVLNVQSAIPTCPPSRLPCAVVLDIAHSAVLDITHAGMDIAHVAVLDIAHAVVLDIAHAAMDIAFAAVLDIAHAAIDIAYAAVLDIAHAAIGIAHAAVLGIAHAAIHAPTLVCVTRRRKSKLINTQESTQTAINNGSRRQL